MCYGQLADLSRKMEKYDYLGGHKLAQDIFKNDSDNVEGFARAIGWRDLENQAKWNQQNPEEGMAHAGVATLGGFAGSALGSYLGTGGGSSGGYVDQLGNAYEGGVAGSATGAAGMGGLMGAGGTNAQQAMKMMQLMNAMQPQQQPGMMAPPQVEQPSFASQKQEPPLTQGYYPKSTNSMGYGMPKDDRFLTEDEKRKRRQMRGY